MPLQPGGISHVPCNKTFFLLGSNGRCAPSLVLSGPWCLNLFPYPLCLLAFCASDSSFKCTLAASNHRSEECDNPNSDADGLKWTEGCALETSVSQLGSWCSHSECEHGQIYVPHPGDTVTCLYSQPICLRVLILAFQWCIRSSFLTCLCCTPLCSISTVLCCLLGRYFWYRCTWSVVGCKFCCLGLSLFCSSGCCILQLAIEMLMESLVEPRSVNPLWEANW